MSWLKNSFNNEYMILEVIKSKKQSRIRHILETTSIVRNGKGEHYIAKKIDINDAYIYNQIDMIRTIKHPNIVGFHDLIAEKDYIYLIQEYCQEGDLAYHIRRQIRKKLCYFSQKVIAKWVLQLLLALEYLHGKKIIHRDIRPQNIFLTADGNLKLGCFRSSKQFHKDNELAQTVISSSYYMAPQCLQNQGYDEKVDIWALGCLIYQLCTLKPIFQQNNLLEQANLILSEERKQLPRVYSKQLQDIFNKCLTKNSKNRQATKLLLREEYFIEAITKLINEKPSSSRIPIKQYNIHFNILAKKTKCNDISALKQKCKIKTKQLDKNKQKQPILHLPKIQQPKDKNNKRCNSKQHLKNKTQAIIKSDIKKETNKDKNRQNSKQIPRRKSIKRIATLEDDHQKKSQITTKKTSLNQQRLKCEEETPKKLLCSPPLLPKPQRKKQKSTHQKQSPQQSSQKKTNLSQTMKQQQLSQQLSRIVKLQQKQEQPKTSANKILDDLGIKQQEQIQFSFELQDENMVRLTNHKNQGNQLMETYKSKLQQLIDQINSKYCPNLSTIQERTQQFDSNTFANLKI